jgi:OOP family OmpA-OmpF porin
MPPRRLEVGGFLGLDYFGDDIELGNSWAAEQIPGTSLMIGAHGGLILLPDLLRGSDADLQLGAEVEAKFAFSSTGEVTEGGRGSYFAPVLGWRAQGIARLRTDFVIRPHLVVGVGGESVITKSPFMVNDTDSTFLWGPGATWALTDRLDARVDFRHGLTAGRIDYIVSTYELQFGITYAWDEHAEKKPPPPKPKDSDGDGFLDPDDKCPLEKETENDFEDEDGCPDVADRDKDGILDADDDCPEKAENVNGIDDEDGCPEEDPDSDGLVGSKDTCPTEPEDFDKFQDEDGCPDADNDNDTIPDATDGCPDQPETWNGFDDTDGCPDELPKALKEFTGVIEGITFDTGKARIRKKSTKTLDKAVATMREYASIRLRIEGHTDNKGKREKNMALSQKRADAVKWYLVEKGIAADRIDTIGHGPDVPRASNKTSKGRAQNRRIEFHIVFQDPTANVAPEAPRSEPQTQPSPQTQPEAPQTQPQTQPTPPAAPQTPPQTQPTPPAAPPGNPARTD